MCPAQIARTIWEPMIDMTLLKSGYVRKLNDELARQVWNIDAYEKLVPAGFIRSYKANLVAWNDPILPMGGIGVDPGLRMGLAMIVAEDVAHTLSIYINRENIPMALFLGYVQYIPILFGVHMQRRIPVVVEGPAYNAKYGQPLLASIRASIILGFHMQIKSESIAELPPLSIRKRVFGNANLNPKKDVWPDLPPDSAAALSMAICAGA